MTKKINYGKILIIVFLTCLIWVWADLAQNEALELQKTTFAIARSAESDLWVSFDEKSSIIIDSIVLKGTVSKIAEIRRRQRDGSSLFEFLLDPAEEGIVSTGPFPVNVESIVRKNEIVRQYGLTVVECKPQNITVDAVELVKKMLTVKCFNEAGGEIRTRSITPAQIEMFVPKDWDGEKLIAEVVLSALEETQARSSVTKVPFIRLGDERRNAPRPVKITTGPEEDRLEDYSITRVTLKFSLSTVLQGKCSIEVKNLAEVIGPISIRATPDAKRAFEDRRYQVRLEINDEDRNASGEIRRAVVYNFPEEFVRRNEIRLSQNQQPVEARFVLTPLPAATTP